MAQRKRYGVVILVVVVAVVAAGLARGIWQNGPRWAWTLADLDRNELLLGGVDDVEDGEIVTVDDDSVVVRYTRPALDFSGVATGNAGQEVCYRIPLDDPDAFRRVTCP
ncbi:hypothetical protein [Cellulosimicrobium cellulans]|uniref:hypothetical protein n=1 Tax=Cellulosimicrobium cellulans TaxID=1710 RepID=UPI0024071CB3|nr:hypothetical protein [Cellulosimicrobium cellulans]